MAKISNTTTYPTKANPAAGDLVIGTDVSGGNATKTFTLQSIANLYSGSGLGTVSSVGLSAGTTGLIISSDTVNPITTTGTFTLSGTLATANGGTGITSLGTRSQSLRVNAAADGLEYVDSNVVEVVRNNTSNAILKGQPLKVVGIVAGVVSVEIATANSSANMPCIGLAAEDIPATSNGLMIQVGMLKNININTVLGTGAAAVGDIVYVAGSSTPGNLLLTRDKPTGSNLIQNVGIITKTGANGNIQVTAIGRTNDLPNLPTGNIWLGDGNGVPGALSIGVNNTVLTSNGTTASWQASTATPIDVGFTPLSIYASTGKALDSSSTGTTIFVQAVCDIDITINAVDFFLHQITGSPQLTVGLYNGTIVGSSSSTLLGIGTTSVLTTLGVNTLTFSTPITLTAGQDIVIYASSNNGSRYLGSATGFSDTNLALSLVGNTTDPNSSLAAAIEESTATIERIALHFYST